MSDGTPFESGDPAEVSLPQFVAIETALAEGFPLRQVLGVESVERDAWSAAEPAWKERLAAPAAQKSGLFQRYEAERAAAEDCLFRRVAPLDEDAGAWVTFQCALSSPQASRD